MHYEMCTDDNFLLKLLTFLAIYLLSICLKSIDYYMHIVLFLIFSLFLWSCLVRLYYIIFT